MLTPRQVLEQAQSEKLTFVDYYADGQAFDAEEDEEDPNTPELKLLPPLSAEELSAFEARLPGPLPDDIRSLLEFTRGLAEPAEPIEFTGPDWWGYEFLLPHAIALGDDGSGNSYAIDVNPIDGQWRHVWFVDHDPPVMVYLCATLAEFLEAVLDGFRLERCRQGHRSVVARADDFAGDVWCRRKRLPRAAECRSSNDAELRQFAEGLSDKTKIADLREPKAGDGFDWSPLLYGRSPKPLRRAGHSLLFGIEPKPSLLARLFGAGR